MSETVKSKWTCCKMEDPATNAVFQKDSSAADQKQYQTLIIMIM